MRPEWESRKRQPRFTLLVTPSVSMSAYFFRAEKVSSSFFPFPTGSCLRCLAVRNPDIGNPLPKGLNCRLCFPDMYPVWHAKGRVSGNCSRSIMLNTLMVFGCSLSNGLSVSTSSTQRLSDMSSTMPQTRCILILPVTGLKSSMRWLGKRRKPRCLLPFCRSFIIPIAKLYGHNARKTW